MEKFLTFKCLKNDTKRRGFLIFGVLYMTQWGAIGVKNAT